MPKNMRKKHKSFKICSLCGRRLFFAVGSFVLCVFGKVYTVKI